MKKYGKCEKMADGTRAKQPKAKSLLLQTYFTSLLSLVLCVSMFFGTSYAWFTSEVENAGNEIYIGTLDVGLFAGDKDLSNSDNKLFDKNIRWEPGYTALETIKIKNEGDLAFRYVLNLIPAAHDSITKPDAQSNETIMELAAVAEFFDVWVYDHQKTGDAGYSKPESYAAITAENSGWDNVGTLADILSGESVLTGAYTSEMIAAAKTTKAIAAAAENSGEEETTPPDPYTGDPDAVAYTIALHMNERAESDVMGHKISLNVKLVAYQMTSEQDGLGSKYDQMVATGDQLKEALANGGMVALASDIKLTEGVTVASDKTVILNLNGHKIAGTASADMTSLITNSGTLSIVGDGEITITADTVIEGVAINAISNRGTLTINGGKISNTGTGNQIGYGIDNYNGATLTVNGGEITANGSSYYDGIRLFCGSDETLVVVNGGKVSTIWAQNPSANKATEVKGTVIINGGEIGTTYYENYTIVKVAEGIIANVVPYGNGSGNTATAVEAGYTVHSFVQSGNE